MKIIMATGNMNKVREIREILEGETIEIISLKEAGIDLEIEENGLTFEENARIKAETIRNLTGEVVLADDSGLVIDFLNGEPGVHSARFMGENASYDVKCSAILEKMKDVVPSERSAHYECVMALAYPDRETWTCKGTLEGSIGFEMKGEGGFGYDPIFFVPEMNMTCAEMIPDIKNAISHRGKALLQVVEYLKKTK